MKCEKIFLKWNALVLKVLPERTLNLEFKLLCKFPPHSDFSPAIKFWTPYWLILADILRRYLAKLRALCSCSSLCTTRVSTFVFLFYLWYWFQMKLKTVLSGVYHTWYPHIWLPFLWLRIKKNYSTYLTCRKWSFYFFKNLVYVLLVLYCLQYI